MTYFGFSGYGTSLADLQNLVPVMKAYNMNIIRIAGTPPWLAQGSHALQYSYVDYILAETDFTVIIDPNHLYGSTAGYTSADFLANLASARAKLLEVATRYKNNPRVFIEIVNEFTHPADAYPDDTKAYAVIQGLINDVRAVCSNPIVWDKQSPPRVAYKPLTGGIIFQGTHAYFGPSQSDPNAVFAGMQTGKASGLQFICTEVGADWNEGAAFTSASVGTLNTFLNNCNNSNFGVCIWIRELTGPTVNPDLIAYAKLGLKIPATIITPPPPAPPVSYNVDIWAIKGGTTDKTGTLTFTAGSTVSITATAAQGYTFGGWLVNNVQHPATENPLVIVVNAGMTVIPIFTETPTPPASTPTGTNPAPIIIILGLLAGAAVAAGAA